MYLLASTIDIGETVSFSEVITPYITPFFVLLGIIATGWYTVHNRKKGALENRAPDVNQIWVRSETDHEKLDTERRFRRKLEDLLDLVLRTFKVYVDRTGGHTKLTTTELKVYHMSVPSIEEDTKE